jgi:hypothetical protein
VTVRFSVTDTGDSQAVLQVADKTASTQFDNPLGPDARESLRWLLEDCPDVPVGPEFHRYQQATESIRKLGVALWESLAATDSARELMDLLGRLGSQVTSVRIVSDDPEFLSIPWELMRPADAEGDPFPRTCEFSRCLREHDVPSPDDLKRPVGPLRILLASPRPYGPRDVAPRTVKGPVLKAVVRSQGAVQIEILRPATLARLEAVLASETRYDIVHFDGHGYFEEGTDSNPPRFGVLFERDDGRPDPVSATAFAEALSGRHIPLVVLNACRSAKTAAGGIGSVATELLRKGLPAVIAMTHNAHAGQVSKYSTSLYDAIADGHPIADAAATAGRTLADSSEAPDRKRQARPPFHVLPVLYSSSSDATAFSRTAHHEAAPPGDEQAIDDLDLLMYRDEEVTSLDRLLIVPRPVVVYGVVGSGKSRFLRTYALYATLTHYFDEVRLISSDELAQHPSLPRAIPASARLEAERSVLHIWDGVDAESLPSAELAMKLLPEKHRLIMAMAHDSVSGPHQRHALGDLGTEVLGIVFGRRLQGWIESGLADLDDISWAVMVGLVADWHAASTQALIRAIEASGSLRLACERLQFGFPEGDHDPLLDPIVRLLLEQMEPPRRELLAFAGLFGNRVFPRLMAVLTHRGLVTDPFAEVVGTQISATEWTDLLMEAEQSGLVASLTDSPDGGFSVPPTVSLALRGILAERYSAAELRSLRLGVVYATLGLLENVVPPREPQDESGFVWRHRRNLLMLMFEPCVALSLTIALDLGEYAIAGYIAETYSSEPTGSERWQIATELIHQTYSLAIVEHDRREDSGAFFNTADKILARAAIARRDWSRAATYIERLLAVPASTFTSEELRRVLLLGTETTLHTKGVGEAKSLLARAIELARSEASPSALAECRQTWQQIVDDKALGPVQAWNLALEVALPEPGEGEKRPVTLSQLSNDELVRDLRAAELHGDAARACSICLYLGGRSRDAGHLATARDWLRSALKLAELNPSVGNAALVAHHLSMTEEIDGDLDTAAHWSSYAIEVAERTGSPRTAADAHYELGIIELRRENHDAAASAFETALNYYRRLDMPDYADDTEIYLADALCAGDYEGSLARLLGLVDRFQSSGSPGRAALASLAIARQAAARDDTAFALSHLDRAEQFLALGTEPHLEGLGERIRWLAAELSGPEPPSRGGEEP